MVQTAEKQIACSNVIKDAVHKNYESDHDLNEY